MAAIGSVWDAGTWTDDIWALGTWGDAEEQTASTPSGVQHGKPIRLREIEKREDLGEYLKAQLKLRHGDLLPQEVKPKPKKKQEAQVELAMLAMEQEQEQQALMASNNDVLLLLMIAEV